MLRAILKNRRVLASGWFVVLLFFTALLAPFLAPYDPAKMHMRYSLEPPSKRFWLGTDDYGRDTLSRLIFGARISMQVAVYSVALALVAGVLLGVVAAYWGGMVDTVVMRMMDILISFPPIVLAIAIVAFLGTGVSKLVLAIGLLYVPRFARIAYSSALSVKQHEYVEAARAVGSSNMRIIVRAILPNMMAPVIVQTSLSLGSAILLESGLSFLGLGPPPPTATWGVMVAKARDLMDIEPTLVLWPSLAIALSVLAFNTLGDGLRDTLDPRFRELERS
ncbi:MAG: ABC transporter permease [Nitrospinota bacterium]|nr:MAG: ABC transporter permease [Nitrospinota bacterium]